MFSNYHLVFDVAAVVIAAVIVNMLLLMLFFLIPLPLFVLQRMIKIFILT